MWTAMVEVPAWLLALLAIGAIGSEVIHQLVRLRSGSRSSDSTKNNSE